MKTGSLEAPPQDNLFVRISNGLMDVLLPSHCQLCDHPASARHDRILCDACAENWPRCEPWCSLCGCPCPDELDDDAVPPMVEAGPADLPDAGEHVCVDCRTSPPPFHRARSWVLYEDKVVEAIHALKYRGGRGLGTLLGRRLGEVAPQLFEDPSYDSLVPIPIHWTRRWWRGYNQAELVAIPLAKALGCRLELGVRRNRSTRKQAQLGQVDRQRNLESAFEVPAGIQSRLRRARVLIVDDVFTTGATTRACARCLLEAGAGCIDVLTLARTA